MEDKIQQIAGQVYSQKETQFGVAETPIHTHNGIDSPQLDPKAFLGFPIVLISNAATAPTDAAPNGTIRFHAGINGTPNWYMWVRLPTKGSTTNVWKGVQLT